MSEFIGELKSEQLARWLRAANKEERAMMLAQCEFSSAYVRRVAALIAKGELVLQHSTAQRILDAINHVVQSSEFSEWLPKVGIEDLTLPVVPCTCDMCKKSQS